MNIGLLLNSGLPSGGNAQFGEIEVYDTLGGGVDKINSMLESVGVAIGGIILVFAVYKLITSFADQNSMSKMQASMLFGVGAFFMAIGKVLKALNIDTAVSGQTPLKTMVTNILVDVLSPVILWIGLIIVAVSVFLLIMSLAHESAEEQTKAQTGLGIGIICIGANSVITLINRFVGAYLDGKDLDNSVIDYVITIAGSLLATAAFYIGLFFAATGIFRLILSTRTEDTRERDQAIRHLIVAIALISFTSVLALFGLKDATGYKNNWVWGNGNLPEVELTTPDVSESSTEK